MFKIYEERPGSKIICIVFDTQYELTSSFLRLQEFYECPDEEFRGKFFTHEQYMDYYATTHKGKFSYFEDWGGFNITDVAFKQFCALFLHNMWKKELMVINSINEFIAEKDIKGSFYIIAYHKEDKRENEFIEHECAHAFWYLNSEYKKEMQKLLERLQRVYPKALNSMKKKLMKMGYSETVMEDELQAYISTTNRVRLHKDFNMSKHIGFDELYFEISSFRSTFNLFWLPQSKQ